MALTTQSNGDGSTIGVLAIITPFRSLAILRLVWRRGRHRSLDRSWRSPELCVPLRRICAQLLYMRVSCNVIRDGTEVVLIQETLDLAVSVRARDGIRLFLAPLSGLCKKPGMMRADGA